MHASLVQWSSFGLVICTSAQLLNYRQSFPNPDLGVTEGWRPLDWKQIRDLTARLVDSVGYALTMWPSLFCPAQL